MTKILTLFESKTFVVGLLTTMATAAAVFGYDVPVAKIVAVLTPLMLGLGVSGWGEVTQLKARLALEHETKLHQMIMERNQAPLAPDLVKSSQAGFVSPRLLVAIVLFGGLGLGVLSTTATTTGCATVQPIVTDVIDCVKAEAAVTSDGYSVMQVLSTIVGEVSAVITQGWAAVEQIVQTLISKFGGDIVACAIDNWPSTAPALPAPDSGSGAGSGTMLAMDKTLVFKNTLLAKFFPGKRINHGKPVALK